MSAELDPRAATATLRVGVVTRPDEPHSIRGYRDNLSSALSASGTVLVDVPPGGPLPRVDVLWDPGLGMRRVPPLLLRSEVPVVVTVHGLRGLTLPLAEAAGGWRERALLIAATARVRQGWRRLRRRVAAVIAVSDYGAKEAAAALGLSPGRVSAIHHGVDHRIFGPRGERTDRGRPYFLMVAQYQPKKNVERVLEAHAGLPPRERPDLVLVAPGCPSLPLASGVTIVRSALGPTELAGLYRGALAFLCPSLHETFGMPLLEAMACACPVLTSDVTACPEVTGDAAVHVDPRDVAAIRSAMRRLDSDAELRATLSARGLARAAGFTWQRSARRHLEVLAGVVEVSR